MAFSLTSFALYTIPLEPIKLIVVARFYSLIGQTHDVAIKSYIAAAMKLPDDTVEPYEPHHWGMHAE